MIVLAILEAAILTLGKTTKLPTLHLGKI